MLPQNWPKSHSPGSVVNWCQKSTCIKCVNNIRTINRIVRQHIFRYCTFGSEHKHVCGCGSESESTGMSVHPSFQTFIPETTWCTDAWSDGVWHCSPEHSHYLDSFQAPLCRSDCLLSVIFGNTTSAVFVCEFCVYELRCSCTSVLLCSHVREPQLGMYTFFFLPKSMIVLIMKLIQTLYRL